MSVLSIVKSIISYFSLVLIVFVNINCQPKTNYIPIPESEINQDHLHFAMELSDKIMNAQKDGSFYQFSEKEASKDMINGLDETRQKRSYIKVKNTFGDYQSLSFDQLLISEDDKRFEVYRFKGVFNPSSKVEIRTVLDSTGVLISFFVKPWRNKL